MARELGVGREYYVAELFASKAEALAHMKGVTLEAERQRAAMIAKGVGCGPLKGRIEPLPGKDFSHHAYAGWVVMELPA